MFLQTGARDLDIIAGSWPLGNQEVAAALAYREYDHQFVFGDGGHTLKHGGSIFPDTLRWLWRDYGRANYPFAQCSRTSSALARSQRSWPKISNVIVPS